VEVRVMRYMPSELAAEPGSSMVPKKEISYSVGLVVAASGVVVFQA
jgi:hypothetical protein